VERSERNVMDAVDYLRDCVVSGRLSRQELLAAFGGRRSRLSEIMNKRRALSIDHIRYLRLTLRLDADMLLRPVNIENPIKR
jgi:antitoxin component HigA of HigAB toxin-antitoxin module